MRKLHFEVSTFVKTVAFVVFICWRLSGAALADDSTVNPSSRENRTAFALSAFYNVAEDSARDANVVVSPLGLQRVLDAASIGADGATKEEIDLATRRTEPEEVWTANAALLYKRLSEDPETKLVGTIWLQKDFKPNADYVDRLVALSGQSLESVDFSAPSVALKTINDWFVRETNGLDPLLGEISPDTRVVVADVVTFHGEWKTKFDPKNTTERIFTGIDGEESSVPMASLPLGVLRYASSPEDGIQYLEIPYKDGRYSLAIVLPDPGRYRKFEKELELTDGATWARKLANLRKKARFQEVRLFLPKFEVKFASDYVETLGKMGISAAFEPRADFSRLSDEKIFINQAFQSARLIVDENGTEAVAATSVGLALAMGIPQEPILFDVKRPFFYLIYRNPEDRNARAFYKSGFSGGMGGGLRAQKKNREENVDEAILFCGRIVKL